MNRIDICKNIIQSIFEYITNPDKLEPHKFAGHFVRKRKFTMLQVIYYLFFSSKSSMFQNLIAIKDCLPEIDFPNISKQALSKARQLSVLIYLKNSSTFLSMLIITTYLTVNSGTVTTFSPLMGQNSNCLILNRILIFLEKCLVIQIQADASQWVLHLSFMMF